MIGIIGALAPEVEGLKNKLTNLSSESISGIDYLCGELNGQAVVIAKCGVGKVFAAICAQTMILNYHPEVIINVGVAGGLDDKLEVLDLVIADKLVQHDMDTSGVGDPVGMISGINLIELPCSKKLVDLFKVCAESLNYQYYIGTIATGDQFINEKEKAEAIVKNFGAIACEMEGGSIAQVCYVNAVDFMVIRCMSDKADESSTIDFADFVGKAADKSINLLLEFIKRY